jgi:hypothetical protein
MNWVLNPSENFAKRSGPGVPILAAGRADNSGIVESLSGEFFPEGHYKLFRPEHSQVFKVDNGFGEWTALEVC